MTRDEMLNVRVPAEIKAALKQFADADQRSVSTMPVRILRAWLETHGHLRASKRTFDKYVRRSEGPVDLVLVAEGGEQRVEATINRRAQTKTRAARIMGGVKLRDWFLDHF